MEILTFDVKNVSNNLCMKIVIVKEEGFKFIRKISMYRIFGSF